jgi:hypothetical protein
MIRWNPEKIFEIKGIQFGNQELMTFYTMNPRKKINTLTKKRTIITAAKFLNLSVAPQ